MGARFAVAALGASLLAACAACSGSVVHQSGDGGAPDGATRDAGGDGATGGEGGSGGDGGAGDGGAQDASEPPLTTVTFTAIADDILNPERGFYDWADLNSGGDLAYVRQNGLTVAWASGALDAYRTSAIPSSYLDELEAGLARARNAGIKIYLRFSYNSSISDPDASKAQILAHLGQLAPLLDANADVIVALQAGFIGAWGEWHSSTNGLDNPTDRAEILAAILDALPASRMTQVRTPRYKSDALGGPLADAAAFSGTDAARVGHHNDCFLASDDDWGTYDDPIETWKDFVAQEGRFTPVGGETCNVNPPRSECASATAEMARLHWSLLNQRYHQGVIGGWETGGCIDEIRRRLGYRLELQRAAYSEAVRPGGVLVVEADVANTGWASPFNARPVFVVLDDGTTRRTAQLTGVDPRRWEAGATKSFHVRLRVPASAAAGTYSLALWLPDDATNLRDRPEYAIRLASSSTWGATTGTNVFATDLLVDPQAPGNVDPAASDFVELP